MKKIFKTIDKQIEILKSRNVTIQNYDKAYNILSKNNYYYLINGYKDLFINYTSIKEKYITNTKLEELYSLYEFDKYGYIPLWVLVRVLSFGKISKFYSLMKPKEQNAISKKYNLSINEFIVILHNLTLARNICAHDEKLYDIKMKNRISSTIYHKKLKIDNKNGNYQYGTRDLFSIVIALKLLLEEQQFNIFYTEIIGNIEKLKKELSTISINKVLYKMGFPKNYKKLLKL